MLPFSAFESWVSNIFNKMVPNPSVGINDRCHVISETRQSCESGSKPQPPQLENKYYVDVPKTAIPLTATWDWLQMRVEPHRLPRHCIKKHVLASTDRLSLSQTLF